MDRLNLSLDQLIAEKEQQNKKQRGGRDTKRTSGGSRENKPRGSFGAARKQNSFSTDDRKSEPYVKRPVEVKKPLVYHSVKILGNGTQTAAHQSTDNSASSVFARLGKPQSGTNVTFSNLKSTVGGSDLQELCSAVGEIKDVQKSGNGTFKVLFARRSDAVTCVAKFNGLTLDGLVMNVALTEEAESSKPVSIFDRIKAAPPANVKEGLFGTAIASDDEDDEEQEVSFHQPQGGRRGNGREPVFQVTLSGAATKHFESNSRRPESGSRRPEQRESREGGFRKPAVGRPGQQRSNGNRGVGGRGGERAPKKEVNLDDDLDAYMAAR